MVCELPWCCRTGRLTINHNWQHSRRFQPAPTSYGLAGALSVVASLLRPSRLRRPGACSRHSVARWPPIPVSESQAFRLPYRVAVYVELTRPTYRAHHAGDSWLLVIRLPPRLLRCGCYMMFHLFVVSGSGQPAGFAIGWAHPSQDSRRLPSSR